jgi:hypothetical protein
MIGQKHFDRLVFQVAQSRRTSGNEKRVGYVQSVQRNKVEQKVRVVIGIRPDGSPWVSPWLHTTDHTGGASREQKLYEIGQNVLVSCPGGDFSRATVSPWAESEAFPAPDHATQINGDTLQMGKLRVSKHKQDSGHFYDIWIAEGDEPPPEHQEQTGKPESGGGGQSGSFTSNREPGKPAMKVRIHESGCITGRVGNDDNAPRFAAHTAGAKIRSGQGAYWIDVQGNLWTTSAPQIKDDKVIPNDND